MFNFSENKFYNGLSSSVFNVEVARQARQFHTQIEGYEPTPLVSLPHLADKLGVKAILIKDESHRFGLNAFKVLGGSYALGQALAKKLGLDLAEVDLKALSAELKQPMVFATATAGNHGTGIAWAARELGQKAVVYMPQGSPQAAVDRINGLGAECIVTDVNYDDTVRLACDNAEQNGWMLVQDTAWEGYEEIPTWISQGYMTMADEAIDQVSSLTEDMPTHVMLQAGVGAMAGGVLGYLADRLGADNFKTVISEPEKANCLYRSGTSGDGSMTSVGGNLDSIMAGLACGEPNPVTWPILRNCTKYFASVADHISATGMRILGNPLKGDSAVTSGESGAINVGLLYFLTTYFDEYEAKNALGLDNNSIVLIFNTEGDTNPERYQRIVWEGEYSLRDSNLRQVEVKKSQLVPTSTFRIA